MSFIDQDPLHERLKDGFSPIGLWWTLAHGGFIFGIFALVVALVQGSILGGIIGAILLLVAVIGFKKFWNLV